MLVLERVTEKTHRSFRVRVADAREFVLHLDLGTGEWSLARIIVAPHVHAARL
jgi:hypothetical protein